MGKEAKSKIFKVVQANADAGTQTDEGATRVRLIRAPKRSDVEKHVLQEFSIDVATHDDVYSLGKVGVEIEETAGE